MEGRSDCVNHGNLRPERTAKGYRCSRTLTATLCAGYAGLLPLLLVSTTRRLASEGCPEEAPAEVASQKGALKRPLSRSSRVPTHLPRPDSSARLGWATSHVIVLATAGDVARRLPGRVHPRRRACLRRGARPKQPTEAPQKGAQQRPLARCLRREARPKRATEVKSWPSLSGGETARRLGRASEPSAVRPHTRLSWSVKVMRLRMTLRALLPTGHFSIAPRRQQSRM